MRQAVKNKLYHYFVKTLGLREYRRGWLKGECPYCGKVEKFGVNLSMNRTNCFVCGAHHKPMYLVMDLEGLKDWPELIQFLDTYEGYEYQEPLIKPLIEKPVVFPKGYQRLDTGTHQLARSARAYISNRGFKVDDLAMKGFGYCDEGPLTGYIIIPYYVKGVLVYYTTRRYMANGPKFNNPVKEDFGIGKNQLLYNYDALFFHDRVFLVESAFNAETLGDQAIGLGGKKISKRQFTLILKSPVKRIVVILDPDALQEAIKLCMDLVDFKRTKLIITPEDTDVNDIGRAKTLALVHQNRYLQHPQLLKMKDELL